MLVAKILVRFGEAHGGISLREEWNVIAAAQVAVAPVDHLDGHFRHVALRGIADPPRQLARRRIVLAAAREAALPLLGHFLAHGNAFGEQP